MIAGRPRRRPLTYKRVYSSETLFPPSVVQSLPPLPDSAKWDSEPPAERWRRFAWIFLIAAGLHLGMLWMLRDVPVYRTLVSQGRAEPVANFREEYLPEIRQNGQIIKPQERQFTVSTQMVPTLPTVADKSPEILLPPKETPLVLPPDPNLIAVQQTRAIESGAGQSGLNRPAQVSVFNITAPAQRVVYLIDISGSMWKKLKSETAIDSRTRFETARDEVRKSIANLPNHVEFNIVLFAERAQSLSSKPIIADAIGKKRADQFLTTIPDMNGETDLVAGLQSALEVKPDSVFLLTDGLANVPEWKVLEQVRALQRHQEAPARLYAVGMAPLSNAEGDQLLRKLTRANGGSYLPFGGWTSSTN